MLCITQIFSRRFSTFIAPVSQPGESKEAQAVKMPVVADSPKAPAKHVWAVRPRLSALRPRSCTHSTAVMAPKRQAGLGACPPILVNAAQHKSPAEAVNAAQVDSPADANQVKDSRSRSSSVSTLWSYAAGRHGLFSRSPSTPTLVEKIGEEEQAPATAHSTGDRFKLLSPHRLLSFFSVAQGGNANDAVDPVSGLGVSIVEKSDPQLKINDDILPLDQSADDLAPKQPPLFSLMTEACPKNSLLSAAKTGEEKAIQLSSKLPRRAAGREERSPPVFVSLWAKKNSDIDASGWPLTLAASRLVLIREELMRHQRMATVVRAMMGANLWKQYCKAFSSVAGPGVAYAAGKRLNHLEKLKKSAHSAHLLDPLHRHEASSMCRAMLKIIETAGIASMLSALRWFVEEPTGPRLYLTSDLMAQRPRPLTGAELSLLFKDVQPIAAVLPKFKTYDDRGRAQNRTTED